MNINKLVVAAAFVCAFIGATMAHPGPGFRHGPGPRFHHGPGPRPHGPGFHHHGPGFRPPPPSLHGWHRGPRPHLHYRSCWAGGVWYDAYGWPYTSPTVVAPAPAVVAPAPAVVY